MQRIKNTKGMSSICIAATVAAATWATDASAGEYPFTTENVIEGDALYARGHWADIDGDGDQDVVLSEDVRWLENTSGVGADFEAHDVGAEIVAYVAIGDLDGDGDLDIAGADDDVRWYESVEGGAAWVTHTIEADTAAGDIEVGDFDGDGDLDIAIAHYDSGEPAWYENPGDPTQSWGSAHIITSDGYDTDDILAGDFDGDGDADLLAADSYNGYFSHLVYENGPWTSTALDTNGTLFSMGAADVDGDGDIDVMSGRETRALLLRNVAGGVFGTEELVASPGAIFEYEMDEGDVDGDGDLDLVMIGPDLAWYENVDDAYDAEHTIVDGYYGLRPAVADADCDGDADILTYDNARIVVFVNETNEPGREACAGGGETGGSGTDSDSGTGGGDESGGADESTGGGGEGDGHGDEGETAADDPSGDGTGGSGDGGAGQNNEPAGGLCSVSVGGSGSAPAALGLLLLALGVRRRRRG